MLEDKELVKRVLKGNGEAFGDIYDKYKEMLYFYVILPAVMDSEAAQEVLQETFLTALKKISTFKWKGIGLFPWLKKIALLKCKEQKRNGLIGEHIKAIDVWNHCEYHFLGSPEKILYHREALKQLQTRIDRTLSLMNERYRQAIELKLKQNRKREECSTVMHMSVAHFDVVFFRACKSFKKIYESLYGMEKEES